MLSIAVALQGVAITALAYTLYRLTKNVIELKKDVWQLLNNRNHISGMEQNDIEARGRNNLDLISLLAKEVDKKLERVYDMRLVSNSDTYILTDLTEKEKKINELELEIKELEEDGH